VAAVLIVAAMVALLVGVINSPSLHEQLRVLIPTA
jgi:hypothetical protein